MSFDLFLQETGNKSLNGHNFCIRTPFSTFDLSKISAEKDLSNPNHCVRLRLSERSEFPKEAGKVEFLPLL
jgi:hypothetical protein